MIRNRTLFVLGMAAAAICALVGVLAIYIARQPVNPVRASLDVLAKVEIRDRWAHPEFLKIREMGAGGVSDLRRVLRQRDSKRTYLLLWVRSKWRGVTNYVSDFPDLNKMSQERWAACQVLSQLGPAARSAVPDLVDVFKSDDWSTGNGAMMALHAIGIDAEVIAMLEEVFPKASGHFSRGMIVHLLAARKPASERTAKILSDALTDDSEFLQKAAISTIGKLGVNTPAVLTSLKELHRSMNELLALTAGTALWELEKKKEDVWESTVALLERKARSYIFEPSEAGPDNRGLGVAGMVFAKGAALLAQVGLTLEEQKRALAPLEMFCEESRRILIKLTLLPHMIELGFPLERAAEVCREGLASAYVDDRLHAARLVVRLGERWKEKIAEKVDIPGMLRHVDIGVRVYGAQVYWMSAGADRKAEVIMPVLIEALNATPYRSYDYPEIQATTLKLLGEVGSEAKAAVSLLEELEKDVNPNVAEIARETREKISAKL